MKPFKTLMHLPDQTACGYYRATAPCNFCFQDLAEEDYTLQASDGVPGFYDAYIVHRAITYGMYQFLRQEQKEGKKIVWEIDDDLWNLTDYNPQQSWFESLKHMLDSMRELADWIWVSTDELIQVVDRPNKTIVVPNLLNPLDYHPAEKAEKKVVLWQGGYSHKGDLDMLVDPILALATEFPDVDFIFWGFFPLGIVNEHYELLKPNVQFMEGVILQRYWEQLDKINPHIGLVPLADNHFNLCKSNLKFLEYGAMNTAPIVSHVDAIPMNGSYLKTTDWYTSIKYLLTDEEARKTIAAKAKAVSEEWLWTGPMKSYWMDAFRLLRDGCTS